MAQTTLNIHVRVMALYPPTGANRPVAGATVQCKDYGWLCDTDLSPFSAPSENDGHAQVTVTFDDASEGKLNPFFVIRIPDAARQFPGTEPPDRRVPLPGEWRTQHDEGHRIPKISAFTDAAHPLEIFVGLGAKLRVAYSDFEADGLHNPIALPEDTTRVMLADYDTFLWIDFLNPDDTLTGSGFDPQQNKIVRAGDKDRYSYFDTWPTEPLAFLNAPGPPRACFDPPGAPVGVLGGGSFDAAGAMAVDAHGFVFVVDGNVVRRFYADGTLCETIGGPGAPVALSAPKGLALDQYRNLYVADTGNNRVVVFQPRLGEGGSGAYQFAPLVFVGAPVFSKPEGVAVIHDRVVDADELLAVVDTGNKQVQLFRITVTPIGASDPALTPSIRAGLARSLSLTGISTFGAAGAGVGQFQDPAGIAADFQKKLYVADRRTHRVSVWRPDPGGTNYLHDADWEKAGGGAGNGNREFNAPAGIAVDRKTGWAYVQENGNNRIQRIDGATGNHLLTWTPNPGGGAFAPSFVAVDPRGEAYVSDAANRRVLRATPYAADGSALGDNAEPRLVGSTWTAASAAGHMKSPGYVTYGADGKLYVADTENDRVLAFARNAAGELVSAPAPAPAGFSKPTGITVGSDGHLYIVDSGNHRVRHFDAAMALVAEFGTVGNGAANLRNPRGIAFSAVVEPVLFISDRDNNRIQMARIDGTFVASLTTDGAVALQAPEDVAVDPQGNIFVADTGNRRVVKFKPDGSPNGSITVTGGSLAWNAPCGVWVEDDGNLLVTDRQNNAVYRVDVGGKVLAVWDLENLTRKKAVPSRTFDPELRRMIVFDAPARAVIDGAGLMAVADTKHHRVRLIRVTSHIDVHLTDLGEALPDISFRAYTEADWKEQFGLRVKAGGDDDHNFITDPIDDFALDEYKDTRLLREAKNTNGATNALRVVRLAHRWLTRMSRMDDPAGRWGVVPGFDRKLYLDVTRKPEVSFYLSDEILLGTDTAGKGADSWDDAVIVHEWMHWVFEHSTSPSPPCEEGGGAHGHSQVHPEGVVIQEGFSEYAQSFWGFEGGQGNRVRGFDMVGGSDLAEVEIVDGAGKVTGREYLYGGATGSPPAFNVLQRGTEVEGYFCNACYQIHHALADPGIQFCDSPGYWYPFNSALTDEQSRRWSGVIWKALRLFPHDPTEEQFKHGAKQYMRQVLEQAHTLGPRFGAVTEAIIELNNQLAPQIALTEGGAAVAADSNIALNAVRHLAATITGPTGRPIAGYTLTFTINGGGALSKASGVSDATGTVTFDYTAPAAAATITLTATYQPDFDTHAEFAPPAKGDDLDTTLRKLYMYELRATNKIWSGTGNNKGAMAQKTVTLHAV